MKRSLAASVSLIGALLLATGDIGTDWKGWVRGILLGILAAFAVNLAIDEAVRRVTASRDHVRQDVK